MIIIQDDLNSDNLKNRIFNANMKIKTIILLFYYENVFIFKLTRPFTGYVIKNCVVKHFVCLSLRPA